MAPKRKTKSSSRPFKVGAKASLQTKSPSKEPKPKASDVARKRQKVESVEQDTTLLGFIEKNTFSELTWINYEQFLVQYYSRTLFVLFKSCLHTKTS